MAAEMRVSFTLGTKVVSKSSIVSDLRRYSRSIFEALNQVCRPMRAPVFEQLDDKGCLGTIQR